MKHKWLHLIVVVGFCWGVGICASSAQDVVPEENVAAESSAISTVYGMAPEAISPSSESLGLGLKKGKDRSVTRAGLDLPDTFYMVFGPVFIGVFLYVIVLCLRAQEQEHGKDNEQSYF